MLGRAIYKPAILFVGLKVDFLILTPLVDALMIKFA